MSASEKVSSPLDPSPDEIRKWGGAAVELMADYFSSLRERRVYPETSAKEIRRKLDQTLPIEGIAIERLLQVFDQAIIPLSRHNGHPRMFGYVQAPGTPIAAIADLLASTLNANLTAWRSAPAAVEVERLTINWIKQILGMEAAATGLFVSGGSMANLAALAAACRSKVTVDLTGNGLQSFSKTLRLYASTETHHSVAKAAGLLGIGRNNVRLIPVDDRFRVSIEHLVASIEADLRNGYLPFCVVANAGTVNTGAFDPLQEVNAVARQFNLWMHVDASYGGFAVLAQSAKPLFALLSEVDSVALDPHKWLYLPVDCGCVLYRNPEAARAAFAYDAEYTRVFEQRQDEAFAFWDFGPELSRRFRALKVWMTLGCVGLRSLGEMIEKDLACARHLEQLVHASDDFEMLAPVELSIFCFRYIPKPFRFALANADEGGQHRINTELDALNERLLVALQRDGSSYLSNTRVNDRFSLRGCVMNYRTTLRDMEVLLDDLRRLANEMHLDREAGSL
jgi:glutamate/tyrosine decarboxylase-like PLP-dependent enzyme